MSTNTDKSTSDEYRFGVSLKDVPSKLDCTVRHVQQVYVPYHLRALVFRDLQASNQVTM